METLPPEVVETFSKYLTPRDLARCCAVSPNWREIFDQDWLWKSRCDPALEEALRTTPSVVEPLFVSPEVENSTLPPISKWRLAYMREEHLWSNWRENNFTVDTTETYKEFVGTVTIHQFLSDTLIVKYLNCIIEIWDVSVIPATLVAETESSIVGDWHYGVLENNMLCVENSTSVQVFLVDVVEKSIKLVHEISLENGRSILGGSDPIFVDGRIFLVRDTEETLVVFDLGKGEKVIEKTCPVVKNKVGNVRIRGIKTAPTSDDVLVTLCDERYYHYYYIFSLKQQVFLPGPFVESPPFANDIIIMNRHYVAIDSPSSLRIIDYRTSEVVFKNEGQEDHVELEAYMDGFIFKVVGIDICRFNNFNLKTKTLTTFFECQRNYSGDYQVEIINNRFVTLLNNVEPIATFHLSSVKPGITDIGLIIPFTYSVQINRSFTRGSSPAYSYDGRVHVYYHW